MSVDAFPAHESTRKRRRWGCTCGCVAVLMVAAVAGLVMLYGILRPTPTFPRYAMYDSAVNGFGVLRIDSTDEGEADLIKFLFKRAEQAQVQGLNETDANLMKTFLKVLRQFITALVQTDSPVYMAFDPVAQQESVTAVVPLRNRLSWMLLKKFLTSHFKQPQDRKGDSDIFPLQKVTGETSASVIAVSEKELVYSDDLQMLNRSLDYRVEPNRAVEPEDRLLERMEELSLDKPPAGEDLALIIVNQPGRLENLVKKTESAMGLTDLGAKLQEAMAAQRISFNDVQAMKVSADLISSNRAKVELTFYFRQAEQSTRFAAGAKAVLPQYSGKREGSPFELRQDVRTRGTPVVVSVDISGIKTWLESVMPASAPAAEPAGTSDTPAAVEGETAATAAASN